MSHDSQTAEAYSSNSEIVNVTSPSRLHFGLLGFANSPYPYGGLGVMIDSPVLHIQCREFERLTIDADPKIRNALEICVQRWFDCYAPFRTPRAHVRVVEVPPRHCGFGSGTQLALAVHLGLFRLFEMSVPSLDQLARGAQRGRRSSIGTLGFRHGGLIYELGNPQDRGAVAPMTYRRRFPVNWRIVLIEEGAEEGLSGDCERHAFAELPEINALETQKMRALVEQQIIPALEAENCDDFGEAVYRYGRMSGACFAQVQGGCFASSRIADVVDRCRRLGVPGVGQSSWGPTVFAIVASQAAADKFVAEFPASNSYENVRCRVVRANNQGARWTRSHRRHTNRGTAV